MYCPFRNAVVDGSIVCDPDSCAMRQRCLPPDDWQIDISKDERFPLPPDGFDAYGPWEPFAVLNGAVAWKRQLRAVKP